MISADRLFENYFDDVKITNARLYGFTTDSIGRLTAANGSGDYTTLIAGLQTGATALGTELGLVDTSLIDQVGKTRTNDQVMAAFILTMKEKKGVIADKLGGFNTNAFLSFYPHGEAEYTNATKTQMPVLTNRVNDAANTNSAALGGPLSALLKAFEGDWTNSRTAQETQKGAVSDNRTDRTAARVAVELANVNAVHVIGAKFPGNVEACKAFFNFSLLFSIAHHSKQTKADVITFGQIKNVFNLSFTDSMKLEIKNTDDNSTLIAYLAATATTQPNGAGKQITAGHGIHVKPSDLGDLTNTFLIIKNLSDVNDGSYLVVLRG